MKLDNQLINCPSCGWRLRKLISSIDEIKVHCGSCETYIGVTTKEFIFANETIHDKDKSYKGVNIDTDNKKYKKQTELF